MLRNVVVFLISLFIGNESSIKRVYSAPIIQALEKEAGLNSKVIIDSDNIAEFKSLTKEAEYLFSTWGMPKMTEQQIADCFPNLKALFYAAGSVQTFARPFLERGVRVFSAWGANAVPVAEYTVSQILLANKGFFAATAIGSREDFAKAMQFASAFPGNYDCKVGIIGAGMIGKLVIQMLQSHNLEIMVYDPFLSDEKAMQMGVIKCPLDVLFSECQTISNHLANNSETVGMLNYELFSKMMDCSTFINTGRGAQVIEDDLVKILTEKPGITAILDVTYPEPPDDGHAFYKLPNVILTPHIAGSTGHEIIRMAEYMLDEFRILQADKPVRFEVTLKMLETMA